MKQAGHGAACLSSQWLWKLIQEDCNFEANLGNEVRPHHKLKIKKDLGYCSVVEHAWVQYPVLEEKTK